MSLRMKTHEHQALAVFFCSSFYQLQCCLQLHKILNCSRSFFKTKFFAHFCLISFFSYFRLSICMLRRIIVSSEGSRWENTTSELGLHSICLERNFNLVWFKKFSKQIVQKTFLDAEKIVTKIWIITHGFSFELSLSFVFEVLSTFKRFLDSSYNTF